MFAPTAATTPDEYIDLLEEPRRSEVRRLHHLIRKTLPHQEPQIIAGMVAYGTMTYRTAKGVEGVWAPVMMASRKQYISVYVNAVKDGQYIAETYKPLLPKANIGKSCIRFRHLDALDIETLMRCIREGDDIARREGFGH